MNILNVLTPWEPSSFTVFIFSCCAFLYFTGSLRTAISPLRQTLFWSGMALLYIFSHTQIDYYAEHQFFVHCIQNTVIHHAAPFLIVLGLPGAVMAAAVPQEFKGLWQFIRHRKTSVAVIDFMLHPVTQTVLFCGLSILWIMPRVQMLSVLDARLCGLMNWTMFIDGLMFWGLSLCPPRRWSDRYGTGWRIGMMLAAIPPQIITGMMLFFAAADLYPLYDLGGRAFEGMSALADQKTGGMILWLPAAILSTAGTIIVTQRMTKAGAPA